MDATRRNQLRVGLATNLMTMAMTFNVRLLNTYPSDLVDLLYATNRATLNDAVHHKEVSDYPTYKVNQFSIPIDNYSRNTQNTYASDNPNETSYGFGYSHHPDRPAPEPHISYNTQSKPKTEELKQYNENGAFGESTTIYYDTNSDPDFQSLLPDGPSSPQRSRNTADGNRQPDPICNVQPPTVNANTMPESPLQFGGFRPQARSSVIRNPRQPNRMIDRRSSDSKSCSTNEREDSKKAELEETIKATIKQFMELSAQDRHSFISSFQQSNEDNKSKQNSGNIKLDSTVKAVIEEFLELSNEQKAEFIQSLQDEKNENDKPEPIECLQGASDSHSFTANIKLDSTVKAVIEEFLELSNEQKDEFIQSLQDEKNEDGEPEPIECPQGASDSHSFTGNIKLDSSVKAVIEEFLELSNEEKDDFIQSLQDEKNEDGEPEPIECPQEASVETVIDKFLDLSAEEQNSFVQNLEEPIEDNEACEKDVTQQMLEVEIEPPQSAKLNEAVEAVMAQYLALSLEDKKLFIENLPDPNAGNQQCEEGKDKSPEITLNSELKNLVETFIELSPGDRNTFVESFKESDKGSQGESEEDTSSTELDEDSQIQKEIDNLVENFIEFSPEKKKMFFNSFNEPDEGNGQESDEDTASTELEEETQIYKDVENLVENFKELSPEMKKMFLNSFNEPDEGNDQKSEEDTVSTELDEDSQTKQEIEMLVKNFIEFSPEKKKMFLNSFNESDEGDDQEGEEGTPSESEEETEINTVVTNLVEKFLKLSHEDQKSFINSFNEPNDENFQEHNRNASQGSAPINYEQQTELNKEVGNIMEKFLELSVEDKKSFIDSFIEPEQGNEESDDENDSSEQYRTVIEKKSSEKKPESPYCNCPNRRNKGLQAAAKIEKMLETVRTVSGNGSKPMSNYPCAKRHIQTH